MWNPGPKKSSQKLQGHKWSHLAPIFQKQFESSPRLQQIVCYSLSHLVCREALLFHSNDDQNFFIIDATPLRVRDLDVALFLLSKVSGVRTSAR